MKKIKFAKTFAALALAGTVAFSAAACSKEDTDTTSATTSATTAAEETTTEETEAVVEFTDSSIKEQADLCKADGMTIKALTASDLNIDTSVFVEAFVATDADGNEKTFVKFTDSESAITHFKEVMAEGKSWGCGTSNGSTNFNVSDDGIEGTIDENGLMIYFETPDISDEEELEVSDFIKEMYEEDFTDEDIFYYACQFNARGYSLMIMNSQFVADDNFVEGFKAMGPKNRTVAVYKFSSYDNAVAYVENQFGEEDGFAINSDGTFTADSVTEGEIRDNGLVKYTEAEG